MTARHRVRLKPFKTNPDGSLELVDFSLDEDAVEVVEAWAAYCGDDCHRFVSEPVAHTEGVVSLADLPPGVLDVVLGERHALGVKHLRALLAGERADSLVRT